MTARRHHYVPECYLKQFSVAVEGKQNRELVVYDSKERKTFKTAPLNVALERDFNTIDLEGHEPDAFENAMSQMESEIGPALLRIIDSRSLDNEEDKIYLLNLICLLHVRNPRFRETKRGFYERTHKIILDILLSSKERWEAHFNKAKKAGFMAVDAVPDYENTKKLFKETGFRTEISNEEHIRTEMETFDHALPILMERTWVLIEAPAEAPFITCDHPVSLMWSEPNRGPLGLKTRNTEILFPLSPNLAIVGAYELDEELIQNVSADEAASANGTTILNSQRQIYSITDAFTYLIDQSQPARKSAELLGDERFKPK